MGDFLIDEECVWFPELEQCQEGANNGGNVPNQNAALLGLIPPIVVLEDPWIMPLMGNIAFLTIATFWTVIPMIR